MHSEDEMHLEEKVMKKIKEEHITFRSRYVFLARKLGLSGGLALSLVLTILFLNIVFSTLKASENLEFLAFGKTGLLAFLEFFPYRGIIVAVLLFVGASVLLSRFDISYQKPFKILILLLLLLVIGGGAVMTISKVNEQFVGRVGRDGVPILRLFFPARRVLGKHGLAGQITQIEDGVLTVKTFRGDQVTVVLTKKTHFPVGSDFQVGDFVRAVGRWEEGTFQAFGIRRSRPGKNRIFGIKPPRPPIRERPKLPMRKHPRVPIRERPREQ